MRYVVAIVLGAIVVGCGTTHGSQQTSITDRARARYVTGMQELVAGNYTEAIMEFNQVAKNPGYVSYAALARLRVGDALFLQEKYDAAIEVYRSFLKQFEGNSNTGYARFRIGHAYYEQIPADWFLAPPVYERQQTAIISAKRALQRFVDLYPAHKLVVKAKALLGQCRKKLYAHEIYVARFYRKRDKPAGVVQRLEWAFRNFPELAGTEDNYLALAQALAKTSAVRKAAAMYEAYLERFPKGRYRQQAIESLRVLNSLGREQS